MQSSEPVKEARKCTNHVIQIVGKVHDVIVANFPVLRLHRLVLCDDNGGDVVVFGLVKPLEVLQEHKHFLFVCSAARNLRRFP